MATAGESNILAKAENLVSWQKHKFFWGGRDVECTPF